MSLYDLISAYKHVRLSTKAATESAPMGSLNEEAVEENEHGGDITSDNLTDDENEGGPGTSFSNIINDATAKGVLHFTADHPLFGTHGLKHLPSPFVPNFVGQTLPHCDQSD